MWHHIDRLVQERRNSSALAMELHLSCTNPSILYCTVLPLWHTKYTPQVDLRDECWLFCKNGCWHFWWIYLDGNWPHYDETPLFLGLMSSERHHHCLPLKPVSGNITIAFPWSQFLGTPHLTPQHCDKGNNQTWPVWSIRSRDQV